MGGSQAWQESFVWNMLSFKRDGTYLDIGSNDAKNLNNSWLLEHLYNWKGICVEIGPQYAEQYKERTCHFVNEDATKVNYKEVFQSLGYPSRIDYLSLDCDDSSVDALKQLPLADYRFTTITIEHDAYRIGDAARIAERAILDSYGYVRVFPDVCAPLGCGMGPNLPFEDWWIDPAAFDMNKINSISAANQYPDEIVEMLKKRADTYLLPEFR
jgi:hypothetical protein